MELAVHVPGPVSMQRFRHETSNVRGHTVHANAMKRSKLLLAGIVAAGVSVTAPTGAMTLGNVSSQSALGQSLRVVIPVALANDEVVTASCLRLLTDGIPGDTPQLVTGRVSFERGATISRLVVTTAKPVNEPALRVSVQSGCGNTTRRDYVLLFDPPSIIDAPAIQVAATQEDVAAQASAPAPPVASSQVGPALHGPAPARIVVLVSKVPKPDAQVAQATSVTTVPEARAPAAMVLANVPVPYLAPANQSTPVRAITAQSRPPRIVNMTTSNVSSGGFISVASAQPMQSVASMRSEPQPQSATLERLWPYAAVALCLGGLGMCAFAVRRQRAAQSPSWMAAAASSKMHADTHASLNTFAHFGDMTEPGPAVERQSADKPETKPAQPAPRDELDTLLNDEVIDENKIRQEWATVASEHAIDIGTDSILQAIATAEREMRIGAPRQVAMDDSLDDELLRKPKTR
jgi:hypothetical protein